jgi:hypothetical protein
LLLLVQNKQKSMKTTTLFPLNLLQQQTSKQSQHATVEERVLNNLLEISFMLLVLVQGTTSVFNCFCTNAFNHMGRHHRSLPSKLTGTQHHKDINTICCHD